MSDKKEFSYESSGNTAPVSPELVLNVSSGKTETARSIFDDREMRELMAKRKAPAASASAAKQASPPPKANRPTAPVSDARYSATSSGARPAAARASVSKQAAPPDVRQATSRAPASQNKQDYKKSGDAGRVELEKNNTDMSKKTKKKKKKGFVRKLFSAVAAVLVLAVAAGALAVFGVIPLPSFQASHTYQVDSSELLVKYLKHPSLVAGDTLEISGALEVDIDESFGGFASLPLVNYSCSGGSGVTFSGGTALLSGGEASANMNGVVFDGTKVYIEAPSTSVTWAGVGDDSGINASSLNGTPHKTELGIKTVGSRFTVPVTFTNTSSSSVSGVTAAMSSPSFIFPDGSSFGISSLGAGESVTAEVAVIATEGGRARITGRVADSAGNIVVSGASDYISVLGEGYYSGDIHTHSAASGAGRSGTVADNIKAGYANGMSFIISTELNAWADDYSQSQVDELTGGSGDFLQLVGYESERPADDDTKKLNDIKRALLAYNTSVEPSYDYGIYDNRYSWTYQDSVYQVTDDGGIAVMPNFFVDKPDSVTITDAISISKSVWKLTAIEIFNHKLPLDDMSAKVGFNVWKIYSTFGAQKTFGVAASDNSEPSQVGTYFISGSMGALTESNIYSMLASGDYSFSNGPRLRFTIANTEMGHDFTTTAGVTTKAVMYAEADSPLTSVSLVKYFVTKSKDDTPSEVVFEEDLTGKGAFTYSNTLDVTVNPNEYYIFEARSASSALGNDVGFASSNPVYSLAPENIEEGDTVNTAAADSLEYRLLGSVKRAENGAYYVDAKSFIPWLFSADSASGNTVAVNYHRNNSSLLADYVTVLITTKDGTQRTETIYIV